MVEERNPRCSYATEAVQRADAVGRHRDGRRRSHSRTPYPQILPVPHNAGAGRQTALMDDLIEQWADVIRDDGGEWWPALP
ncbi:hypothetical protein Cde04nite_34480 [Cellulomonas denverensis]|nr:hypothetical protein Cde04nite_34480 [Cellulomonas denverensis]